MLLSRFLFPDATFDEFVSDIAACETSGFHGVWVPQVFGWDALTALAVAAAQTSRIRFGTAVLPTYPTHPLALAAQAMSVQSAANGRLELGVGASHRFLVEDSWGMSYERPATRMRSYLAALRAGMAGEEVDIATELLVARSRPLQLAGPNPPPILLAAMGSAMLRVAGAAADGVVLWLSGPHTIRAHVLPTLAMAADAAGRRTPRLVAALPVCVTSDRDDARKRARREFAPYTQVPSYRAVLDRERAEHAGDVALIGEEDEVQEQFDVLARAGVDELAVRIFGEPEEQARTCAFLTDLAEQGSAHHE